MRQLSSAEANPGKSDRSGQVLGKVLSTEGSAALSYGLHHNNYHSRFQDEEIEVQR